MEINIYASVSKKHLAKRGQYQFIDSEHASLLFIICASLQLNLYLTVFSYFYNIQSVTQRHDMQAKS